MTGQVLKAALDAVRTRLSAHFNSTMAAEYGVAASLAIDPSTAGRNSIWTLCFSTKVGPERRSVRTRTCRSWCCLTSTVENRPGK